MNELTFEIEPLEERIAPGILGPLRAAVPDNGDTDVRDNGDTDIRDDDDRVPDPTDSTTLV